MLSGWGNTKMHWECPCSLYILAKIVKGRMRTVTKDQMQRLTTLVAQ